jgi:hypothetical protein
LRRRTAPGETAGVEDLNPSEPGGANAVGRTVSATGLSDSVEERRSADRRDRPTGFWRSLRSPRRRVGGRRAGEGENTYVDRYRKSDILLLGAVFALNIADALFTLIWLRRGGSEGNPIMDWFLQQGDFVFLGQKCLVVGLWLIVLVVHKNFQLARAGLWLLLALYGGIFVYHIFLQLVGVPMPPPAPV